jgi:hypothetical protein
MSAPQVPITSAVASNSRSSSVLARAVAGAASISNIASARSGKAVRATRLFSSTAVAAAGTRLGRSPCQAVRGLLRNAAGAQDPAMRRTRQACLPRPAAHAVRMPPPSALSAKPGAGLSTRAAGRAHWIMPRVQQRQEMPRCADDQRDCGSAARRGSVKTGGTPRVLFAAHDLGAPPPSSRAGGPRMRMRSRCGGGVAGRKSRGLLPLGRSARCALLAL